MEKGYPHNNEDYLMLDYNINKMCSWNLLGPHKLHILDVPSTKA